MRCLIRAIDNYFVKECSNSGISEIFSFASQHIANEDYVKAGVCNLEEIGTITVSIKQPDFLLLPSYRYEVEIYFPVMFSELYLQNYVYEVGKMAYNYHVLKDLVCHIKKYSLTTRPGDFKSLFNSFAHRAEKFEFSVVDYLYQRDSKHEKHEYHHSLYSKYFR